MTRSCSILAVCLLCCAGCQTTPPAGDGGPAGHVNGDGQANTNQGNGNAGGDPLLVSPLPSPDKMDMEILWGNFYWDEDPYPDGVAVKLRLWRLDTPLAFALQQGLIEFIVYEGAIADEALSTTVPYHIWRYTARGLGKAGGKKVIIGWQYEIQLDWQDNVPRKEEITLSARVVRPGKPPLYAKPAKIRLTPK